MTKLTKEVLETTFSNIVSRAQAELLATPQDELSKYFYFVYDPKHSKEWNLYKFSDALEMFKSRCRQWEEFHNGPSCVVERVRDTYLMPKIKEFWAKVATGENGG